MQSTCRAFPHRLIAAFLLVLVVTCALALPAQTLADTADYYYQYAAYGTDGDASSGLKEMKTSSAVSATAVTSGDIEWGVSGETTYYVVAGNTTLSSRPTVKGDVVLILADGATLTADKGIAVGESNSLTITVGGTSSSIAGSGALVATGGNYAAGIGGGSGSAGGGTGNFRGRSGIRRGHCHGGGR